MSRFPLAAAAALSSRVPRVAAVALIAGALVLSGCSTSGERPRFQRTRAESSDWTETTRYDEVMTIMEQLAGASDRIHLTHMGYTLEGREIPLAVVGNVANATPAAVRDSGMLRVYLQGNIHAGEVCGKEALLILLREIARGDHSEWFDRMVLLVAPIYNADGNERISLENRPGQNGPIGGMGQRPNAQGLDLNRDHMKVESPEARSLMSMLREYDPQVGVDLHTTNGTRHGYYLTYSPPLNPATDASIVDLLRGEWLPAVTTMVRERTGQEIYYYGNVPFRADTERGWYTFDHRPRFNNNYLGLRNRFAILGEAYAYATFGERVAVSLEFTRAILDWAVDNTDRIARTVESVDAASVVGQPIAMRSDFERSPEPVDILMGEAEVVAHPYSGRRMVRRLPAVHTETMPEFGTFRAVETSTAPEAYLVPAELASVIDRLAVHGIETRTLEADETLEVERFRIASSTVAEREFQGHRERTLEGTWEPAQVTVPAGTVRVEIDQPLGRLAVVLLEPRSDDGLADWNLLDDALDGASAYPVLRIPAR